MCERPSGFREDELGEEKYEESQAEQKHKSDELEKKDKEIRDLKQSIQLNYSIFD